MYIKFRFYLALSIFLNTYFAFTSAVVAAEKVPADSRKGVVIERIEASVNAGTILLSDISKFRETVGLRKQLDPLFAGTSVSQKDRAASDIEIVNFLVDEKIILQQFAITDAEVEAAINSIQIDNHIDRTALKSALKDQGYKFDDYFELIRASVAKRNLVDRDIRTKVTINDDDVKNYFYNHYSKGKETPTAYRARIISVSMRSYKTLAAAREVALGARKALENGEAFEEVAKRVSDDATAPSGGDLGELTDDQMSAQIRTELKKLKIGQITTVLQKQDGFFILKLVDLKSAESERYEKNKEEIRQQLSTAEFQHQIALWLERQRLNSFIHRAGDPALTTMNLSPAAT